MSHEAIALSRLWSACDRSLAKRDEDDGARRFAPMRECDCPSNVVRCAHIDARGLASGPRWWVRIVVDPVPVGEPRMYLVKADHLGKRKVAVTLADAHRIFEAHENAMRKTLEAIA